jgi:hypothetical protein
MSLPPRVPAKKTEVMQNPPVDGPQPTPEPPENGGRRPTSKRSPPAQADAHAREAAAPRVCLRAALLLPSLLSLTLPGVCQAQSDGHTSSDVPELRRELAEHNFIPSKFSLDPFVSTYVSSETGFGYGTAPGHSYDVNGNPIGLANYDVGAFAQILNYQYGFVDWWAVRASAKIIVYSGLNGSGAATVGTNALANAGLGTTVSFKVGERLRLGGSLDVAFGPSVFFNIVQAVKDSIQNGEIVSPVNSNSSFSITPAFVGAWALDKSLGLTFSASYQYTTAANSNTTASTNLISGNAVLDFDLASLKLVPIGFLGGFQTTFSADATRFLQFRYQFGIFYTAVKALNVGLEIVYLRAPVVGATDVFLSSVQGLILLQYNFN